jgi:hypothetical protein
VDPTAGLDTVVEKRTILSPPEDLDPVIHLVAGHISDLSRLILLHFLASARQKIPPVKSASFIARNCASQQQCLRIVFLKLVTLRTGWYVHKPLWYVC